MGIAPVGALRLAGSNDATPVLSRQLIPSRPAGKAAAKHPVQPLFHQRRAAPGIERMLENNHLMLAQEILLAGDIDKKIRIVRVEIVHGNIRQL